MNPSASRSSALASAGIALLLAAGLVQSKDDASGVETILAKCEPEEVEPGTSSERYDIVIYAGECPNGERTRRLPDSHPPEPAEIHCTGIFFASTCLMWPHGDGLTYAWSVYGPADLVVSPDNTVRQVEVECVDTGMVTLSGTVTSPFGLPTVVETEFFCP